MMALIRRGRRGAVGAYSAAGGAPRAASVNRSTTAYDRLIQATPELDPGEIATVSVNRIVIPRRQQDRTHVVVPGVASA